MNPKSKPKYPNPLSPASTSTSSRRGGARPGAGRPRSSKYTRSIFVTDLELVEVRKFLERIRKSPVESIKTIKVTTVKAK